MTKFRRRTAEREAIVRQVIEDHFLTEEIFFSGTKWSPVVVARRDAIKRLHADGAFKQQIAELIKREVSVVRYHLNAMRRDRVKYNADKWIRLKKNPTEYQEELAHQRLVTKLRRPRMAEYKRVRAEKMRMKLEAAE